MRVIDNFIHPDQFQHLQDLMLGHHFPWFYNDGIVVITETGSYSGSWDLLSATAETTSPSMNAQNNLPYGFYFKPDGTRYWMIGTEGSKEGIFEYSVLII